MSKGSDINVGSIEEDINELKTLLFQDRLTNYGKRKMIDYYENEIAKQKQINEEHRKENGLLRQKVRGLEAEVEKYKKALIKRIKYCNELEKDLFENCENYVVNKQKIKDKIEELKESKNTIYSNSKHAYILEHKIGVLQQLLQESEDK